MLNIVIKFCMLLSFKNMHGLKNQFQAAIFVST